MLSDQDTITNILAWVDSRIEAEVTYRPDSNLHKSRLADTWNQVRDHLIGLRSTPVYAHAPVSARAQPVALSYPPIPPHEPTIEIQEILDEYLDEEDRTDAWETIQAYADIHARAYLDANRLEAGLAASRVGPDAVPATGTEMPPAIEARLKVWLTLGAGLNPHTMNLVVRFARALAKKLADAETKYGYGDGWRSPEWMDECRARLQEQVAKGDPRDVAAYCAFLWHHGASTATPPNATNLSASEQG